jgi:hypothetical protein
LRLITLWAVRTAKDDTFPLHVGLGDILADNIVNIVAAGDLFVDLDNPTEPSDRETQRRRQLIEAWLSPRSGRTTQ